MKPQPISEEELQALQLEFENSSKGFRKMMNDGKRFAFTLVAATLLWAAWLIWKGLPSNEIKGLLNQWVVPAFVMTGIGWIVVYRVYRKGLRRLQDDIGAKLVMVGEAQVIKVRRPGSHNQEVHLSDGMVLRGLAGMYQEYQVGVRVQYRISESGAYDFQLEFE